MNLYTNPDYVANSRLVEQTVAALQPRNGTDYSSPQFRRERETVAVNVHNGEPPLLGVH